ncbi:MAG: C1 family peptidase, partial [Clostridiales bacterium]|nr:C1 family peptidase [Clostridiales bacterium]
MKKTGIKIISLVLSAIFLFSMISFPAGAVNNNTLPKLKSYRMVEEPSSEYGYKNYHWEDENGNVVESPSLIRTGEKRERIAEILPTTYDSRDYGYVTSVKDQGDAGNCWAFSGISAIESNLIKNGYGTANDFDFSEAHLVW